MSFYPDDMVGAMGPLATSLQNVASLPYNPLAGQQPVPPPPQPNMGDNLALAFQNALQSMGPVDPRSRGQVAQYFLRGLASGFAGPRLHSLEMREKAWQQQVAEQAARNRINAQLSSNLTQIGARGAEARQTQAAKPTTWKEQPATADQAQALGHPEWTGKPNGWVMDVYKAQSLGPYQRRMATIKADIDAGIRNADGTPKRAPGEPLDFTGDVQTDTGGRQYLDVGVYVGGTRQQASKWALAHGIKALGSADASNVTEVDNARMNEYQLQRLVESKLPPDLQARALYLAYGGARLQTLLQSDADVAAYGAWRNSAIKVLRAAAGAKGLRINQAEINMALQNDIPSMNDNVQVALQKINNIDKQLQNVSTALLVNNRSGLLPGVLGGDGKGGGVGAGGGGKFTVKHGTEVVNGR